MSTESTLTFKVIWTDLPRIKTAEKQKKPALQGSFHLAPSYHSPNTKSFTQCLWGAGENFVTRVMWSATMDAVMSWLIPGAPPGLLERPSHLKIGYLPQDPQSGIHGRLPTLLFSQPFYSVSKLPEACQLRGYSCATQPELSGPLSPPTFCSTCSDFLGVLLGACFPTCDLVHPSEIKHSPVHLGFTSGFPSGPRFRFDLGLRGPRASLIAQLVKNTPAMQETWVWSLGWEDSLEKGMATYSSILAWRIPWTV